MAQLYVIDPIEALGDGPFVLGPSNEVQPVFLSQGSLDGACGPYSLFMALLITGVIDYDHVTNLDLSDRRSAVGKLFSALGEFSTLMREGSHLGDLEALVATALPKKVRIATCEDTGKNCREFVVNHLRENHPVVLGLDTQEGGHWVVVIGFEYDESGVRRFMLLDPSEPEPDVCAWNGLIEARGTGGRYPYAWWSDEERKARMEHALAVWRR